MAGPDDAEGRGVTGGPSPRAATPADAEAIAAMIRASNRLHGHEGALFTRDAALRDVFGDDPVLSGAVAEAAGAAQPVAVVLWCDAYESAYAARGGYIVDLFVEPPFRRRGLGRALLSFAAAAVKARGGEYLWWNAADWNDDARAFYRGLGAGDESVRAHAVTFEAFERLAAS